MHWRNRLIGWQGWASEVKVKWIHTERVLLNFAVDLCKYWRPLCIGKTDDTNLNEEVGSRFKLTWDMGYSGRITSGVYSGFTWMLGILGETISSTLVPGGWGFKTLIILAHSIETFVTCHILCCLYLHLHQCAESSPSSRLQRTMLAHIYYGFFLFCTSATFYIQPIVTHTSHTFVITAFIAFCFRPTNVI